MTSRYVHFNPVRIAPVILLIVCGIPDLCMFAQEGGYVAPLSATTGDTLSFYISTLYTSFDLRIYKFDSPSTLVSEYVALEGDVKTVPDSSYWYGCNWPASVRIVIPPSWTSGLYYAEFPTSQGAKDIVFFVKEIVPGSHSKLVVSLSVNTWQAYNNFGGKSLYESNSTEGQRSYKVSFERPYADNIGNGQYFRWANKFIAWLHKENIDVEFTNSIELDRYADLLNNYKVIIIAGHDEYWTREERRHVESFLRNGGNVIILGGNTCWWQVRYEDGWNKMVCYKKAIFDPLNGVADSLVTVNWYSPPVNDPENKWTGVSFRTGGYVAFDTVLAKSLGYGDYTVYNSWHWVFDHTGLKDGNTFGKKEAIVGNEVDGSLFEWQNGVPSVTGTDDSPLNFKILGLSPAANFKDLTQGHATMGIYRKQGGGWVFNAATTGWSDGFPSDTVVQQITKNVIERFSSNRYPPEIVSWSPFIITSDSIHHELEYFNRRECLVLPGDSVRLSVIAVDPSENWLQYSWFTDGHLGSGDTSFVYRSIEAGQPLKTVVTVCIGNSHDTTTLSWDIYHSPLKITSVSQTTLLWASRYTYKVEAANFFRDSLQYNLVEGPSWLTIDDVGVLSGNVPADTGSFEVRVQVRNQHDQTDSQSFLLHVLNDVQFEIFQGRFPPFELWQNFPNPFNPVTTITYQLNKPSVVDLTVMNELGQRVRSLINNEFQDVGKYHVAWNGQDDFGKQVSNGVYFCRLESFSLAQTLPSVKITKMVLIK